RARHDRAARRSAARKASRGSGPAACRAQSSLACRGGALRNPVSQAVGGAPMTGRRLSVCYVVPGHDLLSTVGPSRNVGNRTRALSEWADVTVAFRRAAEAPPPGLRVLEIQPGRQAATVDDAAMKGIGYGEFFAYLADVRRFAQRELQSFDVVLEKSWLLS